MLLHFRLYATMAVIVGAILGVTGAGYAEWTEPVCLAELNDHENGFTGHQPCISSDGLSIFFVRQVPSPDSNPRYQLFEAVRDDVYGVFPPARPLSELNSMSSHINNPWISTDGLRLYYAHVDSSSGKSERYIKMAVRNSTQHPWVPVRTFHEIHSISIVDSGPTLTEDELTLMWMSVKHPIPSLTWAMYTATRESVHLPFSAPVEVVELSELGAYNPHLSGDGLRVYFGAPRPGTAFPNIYMMTRPSLSEPFGNIEHLDGVTGPEASTNGSSPHLSPDEKTIYFHGGRGDTLYERGTWVSYWIDDPYDAAVESIEAAIAAKREAIAAITSGLDKDREVLETLNELGETGDINPKYIEAARRYVLNAIKRQMKAIAELKKSISELEKALEEL